MVVAEREEAILVINQSTILLLYPPANAKSAGVVNAGKCQCQKTQLCKGISGRTTQHGLDIRSRSDLGICLLAWSTI